MSAPEAQLEPGLLPVAAERDALQAAYPELHERLPRVTLGRWPTAIERLPGLLPADVELWVKRDDQAGTLYGGNKVRKLEYLLAGLAPGARVITSGGHGSHHVLATALYGRARGLTVAAVLYPQPTTARVLDTLRCDLAAGAQLFPARSYLGVPLQAVRALRASARIPGPTHLITPGGSSPLGTLGWIAGGLEIAAQVAAGAAPRFDAVYAALGSGGTVAGLWLGLGAATEALVAVPVVPALVGNRAVVALLAYRAQRLLRSHVPGAPALPPRPRLVLRRGFLGGGYGHVTAEATEAEARAAACGLAVEPTYTGKVLAALLADARAGRLAGKRVLFLHSYNGHDLAGLLTAAPARLPAPWSE